MLEPAVVVLRLMQYLGAAVLMGSSLFYLYALPRSGMGSAADAPWARRLLLFAAASLAVTATLGLLAQTSVMAGSVAEGLKLESLAAVVGGMALGKAALVRTVAATAAFVLLLVMRPSRAAWLAGALLGAVACASFAWMGHAAATEGPIRGLHLAADIGHAWAAAIWIGALCAFLMLLRAKTPSPEAASATYRALHGFSGLGTLLVAVLVATGLVNSWILVGPAHVEGLWTTDYGRLLSLKLALFGVMLALAAANRFRLTPALHTALGASTDPAAALSALRRSVAVEFAVGVLVFGLVGWFGTLAPPASL